MGFNILDRYSHMSGSEGGFDRNELQDLRKQSLKAQGKKELKGLNFLGPLGAAIQKRRGKNSNSGLTSEEANRKRYLESVRGDRNKRAATTAIVAATGAGALASAGVIGGGAAVVSEAAATTAATTTATTGATTATATGGGTGLLTGMKEGWNALSTADKLKKGVKGVQTVGGLVDNFKGSKEEAMGLPYGDVPQQPVYNKAPSQQAPPSGFTAPQQQSFLAPNQTQVNPYQPITFGGAQIGGGQANGAYNPNEFINSSHSAFNAGGRFIPRKLRKWQR